MSVERQINISWPSTVPLPFWEAGGSPNHAIISSPIESASFQRRLRFSASPVQLMVKWVLSIGEYIDFKDFYLSELNLGTSLFKLDLRYPLNSELTTWVARFTTSYRADYLDGMWEVSALLDLETTIFLSDASPAEATGFFFLRPSDNPLFVQNKAFIVKDRPEEENESDPISGFFVSSQQRRFYVRGRPFYTRTS